MELITKYVGFIYPITLMVLIAMVMLWYSIDMLNKKSKIVNMLLILSVVMYVASFLANYAFEWFVIVWFIRDLLIFAVLVKLWEFFLRYKYITIPVFVIGAAVVIYFYYRDGEVPLMKREVVDFKYDESSEILFDIKNKSQLGVIENLLAKYKPTIQLAFPQVADTAITELDDYYTLNIADSTMIDSLMMELNSSGLTDDIERNETIKLSPVETSSTETNAGKPFTCNSLNDPEVLRQWGFSFMEVDNLYKALRKKEPVKKARIFILDTGVDATHEDLADNYVSLSAQYDKDTDRHGTHCAGIANAVSNNKIGIASLNFTGEFTTITSITVLPQGSGTQESVIDGIIMAADNGADVISMSLGGYSSDARQRAYNQAIKYANNKGAIVVVAAGNESDNARNHVPAACKGVIAVSAVDNDLQKASFSNFVSEIEFKVAAPGVNIYSTIPSNKYLALNGTSMATPYVAGLVGIMKSLQTDLTTETVYKILNTTGIDTKNTDLTGKFIQPLPALANLKASGMKSSFSRFFIKVMSFKSTR